MRWTFKGNLSGGALPPLAHQGRLFEGDEDRSHPGNVLGLFAGFGVEVTQAGHPLPLRARAPVVRVGQERLLRRSAGHGWETVIRGRSALPAALALALAHARRVPSERAEDSKTYSRPIRSELGCW